MQNASQYLICFLVLALSGCESAPPRSGIPTWDYERDEVSSLVAGAIFGKGARVSGAVIGGVVGTVIGGTVQHEIELTPSALTRIIENTLTEPAPSNAQVVVTTTNSQAKGNWGIAESNEGQITTDWTAIAGKKAGLLWWKKKYQAEVRHIITIKRSYRSPHFANFSIVTEVRERPNSNYQWVQGDPELGRASFEQLKNVLLASLRKSLKGKRDIPNES